MEFALIRHFFVFTAAQVLGWLAWQTSRCSAACFYAASRMYSRAGKELEAAAEMEGR